jgi:hypothetical protein
MNEEVYFLSSSFSSILILILVITYVILNFTLLFHREKAMACNHVRRMSITIGVLHE